MTDTMPQTFPFPFPIIRGRPDEPAAIPPPAFQPLLLPELETVHPSNPGCAQSAQSVRSPVLQFGITAPASQMCNGSLRDRILRRTYQTAPRPVFLPPSTRTRTLLSCR